MSHFFTDITGLALSRNPGRFNIQRTLDISVLMFIVSGSSKTPCFFPFYHQMFCVCMPNSFSIFDRKYLFKCIVNVVPSEPLKQTKVTMGFDVQLNFMAISLFNSRLSVCYETRGLSTFCFHLRSKCLTGSRQ